MGLPKKKLPKVIKSLPKLGLFARVVVEKLTEEEIKKWTSKAPVSEPKSLETTRIESSEDEDCISRKRKRVVAYIDSSNSSSSDTTTSNSTSDSSESESCSSSSRRRIISRGKRRGRKSKSDKTIQEWKRIQPVRSAKRNPVIIDSDSDEDDASNLLLRVYGADSLSSSKPVDSIPTIVATPKEDEVEQNVVSNKALVSSNSFSKDTSQTGPTESSVELKSYVAPILIQRDSSSRSDGPALHTLSEKNHYNDCVISNSVSPSSPKNLFELPKVLSNGNSAKIISSEENIDALNEIKKFTVVNKDETNVGKIRLRSLQSLGASDSFIKEANLKQNSSVGKIVQDLYKDHFCMNTKNLLNDIAVNLRKKLTSTEDFNSILKKMDQSKCRSEEIVNIQLEAIVKVRQEYDTNICKLFTNVVELFYAKLEQRKELENFPTLMYLGFLYILKFFLKMTNNQYKKGSLFKNVVLVFTESLRNGRFRYEHIINFFLSNNFHAHCFKLIEHIGAMQTQNSLFLLKANKEANLAESKLKSVPVRNISYKMVDSRMIIEFSKTLEEVETEGVTVSKSLKKSEPSQLLGSVQSKSISGNSSNLTSSVAQSSPAPKSVIVSSKNDRTPIDLDKILTGTNTMTYNPPATNPRLNPVQFVNLTKEVPAVISNVSNGVPQKSNETLDLRSILNTNQLSSNDNPLPFSFQNKQTSIICAPQHENVPRLGLLKSALANSSSNIISPSCSQASISNSTKKIPNAPVTSKSSINFIDQVRSMTNVKISKVNIVRPILKVKQIPSSSSKPMNTVISQSNLSNTIAQSNISNAQVHRLSQDATNKRKNFEVVGPSATGKKATTPQVSQSIFVSNPPTYSEAVRSNVKNSYPISVSNSLQQALLSNMAKKNSSLSSNQQLNNQIRNSYNGSNVMTISNSSIVSSNCQPNDLYQSVLQNPAHYQPQNSNQATVHDSYGFSANDLVSTLNLGTNNQEVQQYQVPQNQNLVSSSSVLYNDNSNLTLNNDSSRNSSILYGNSQLNNQSVYYNNDNSIASNEMMLCDMPSNAVNHEGGNGVYLSYTQSVPLNQTHNQIPVNSVHSQFNQMQTQPVPLNQAHTQSVGMNQLTQSTVTNQPTPTGGNQYFSTPSTTIHWGTQASSYVPSVVQSFPKQIHYQNYQPNQ